MRVHRFYEQKFELAITNYNLRLHFHSSIQTKCECILQRLWMNNTSIGILKPTCDLCKTESFQNDISKFTLLDSVVVGRFLIKFYLWSGDNMSGQFNNGEIAFPNSFVQLIIPNSNKCFLLIGRHFLFSSAKMSRSSQLHFIELFYVYI